jgi:ubiquinone/menaquinone biosynthesis C-methylase UbiE
MIAQIRRRLARQKLDESRVHFVNADFLTWPAPAGSFDLISTHFFLDCFNAEQLPEVIAKLAAAVTPDAVWLLSDFQIPAARWQRWRAQVIITALYQFFRLATQLSARELISPHQWMEQAGFALCQSQSFSFGLTHSDMWKKTALVPRYSSLKETLITVA